MSGWTAATLHASTETANENLNEHIEQAYGDAGLEPWTAGGYADRTIQVGRATMRSSP